MLRHYSCNKYKSYSIRNHYFKNGLFETDDPDVQRLIEGADGYGVFIHPVETPQEIAAMKEIEEIPFASDITRVIFVPKRNIHGLLRGHDVRISEICPFFFRIQVAIVTKSAQVEQGTIRP